MENHARSTYRGRAVSSAACCLARSSAASIPGPSGNAWTAWESPRSWSEGTIRNRIASMAETASLPARNALRMPGATLARPGERSKEAGSGLAVIVWSTRFPAQGALAAPPGETPTEHPEKRQPEPRLARSTLKWAIALPFSAKQTASAPVQDFIVVNGQFAALRRHAGGLPFIRSQAPREPARNNPPSTAGSGRLPRNSRARCCPPGSPLLRFPSGSIARSLPFLPARSPARSP